MRAQWRTIAVHGHLVDHEYDVAAFARLPGWAAGHVLACAAHYQNNPGGKDRTAMGGPLPAWPQLPTMRTRSGILPVWGDGTGRPLPGLPNIFDTQAQGRTGAQWRTIAGAVGANQADAAAVFARLPNTLTAAHVAASAGILCPTLTPEQAAALLGRLHAALASGQINTFMTAPLPGGQILLFYETAMVTDFGAAMAGMLGAGWGQCRSA